VEIFGARLSRTRLALGLVGVAAATAILPLGGCAPQPSSQSTVITQPQAQGITPLQRGTIRRDVLDAAQPALTAWLSSDPKAMAKYFKPYYVSYYTNLYSKYAKQGKQRVRKLKVSSMNVSDMNKTGTQALVDVTFIDHQYFADLKGNPITKPTNKSTFIQLTLDKQKDGTWRVDNMIADAPVLN